MRGALEEIAADLTPETPRRINTPNPSAVQRILNIPNDFRSRAERAADLESDDEPEDGDLLVDSNTGLTYIYKAPVEDDHLNERLIPVENAVTSFKQAVEISEFIRGVLHSHRKDATVTVADPSAVSSATFFLHGLIVSQGRPPLMMITKTLFSGLYPVAPTRPKSIYRVSVILMRSTYGRVV
jgi:hypothetical protein